MGHAQLETGHVMSDHSQIIRVSMGPGFCNLDSLKWLTEKPLTPTRFQEQRSKQSHKVGREEEGMSSNHPELVTLRECLETHPDNENLLYLTDNEATLQAINKWIVLQIGGGSKLSLTKTEDGDVLRDIIVKLQQRVKAKMKQEQEKTWNTPTNRTIYQWSETSKTKGGVNTTKQTAWTQAVRNRMRQKTGEIQVYRATYEKGTEKWRKEYIPRKEKGNISTEGQELLEDKEISVRK
jgi:hypothetical protein